MIEILIVCGIKNYDAYHEKIIGIINNINKPTTITKELCNFTTLQNSDDADIYISNFAENHFLFNKSLKKYVVEDDLNEDYSEIKEFNITNNNKFDYIILEHCPINKSTDMIPQFIKHYNLLKKNGFLIVYINSYLNSEFNFSNHKELPILDNLYFRYNNNIYKKENDDIYNMETNCDNYYNYCVKYNPKLNYKDLDTIKDEGLDKNNKLAEELATKYKILDLVKKYEKYKKKYLEEKKKYLEYKKNVPHNAI